MSCHAAACHAAATLSADAAFAITLPLIRHAAIISADAAYGCRHACRRRCRYCRLFAAAMLPLLTLPPLIFHYCCHFASLRCFSSRRCRRRYHSILTA
jgi:hypothetical protein